MKTIYLLCLVLLLPSCCPHGIIENRLGALPDSALSFSPYQDGSKLKLKHSAGKVVTYSIFRETTEEYFSPTESCVETIYELNTTRLIPDYPVFDLRIDISNLDTIQYYCNAYIGYDSFEIPTFDNDYYEKADSISIDSTVYYDVYLLSSIGINHNSPGSIYADSLYYNFENGILKIIMSNEEFYQITY